MKLINSILMLLVAATLFNCGRTSHRLCGTVNRGPLAVDNEGCDPGQVNSVAPVHTPSPSCSPSPSVLPSSSPSPKPSPSPSPSVKPTPTPVPTVVVVIHCGKCKHPKHNHLKKCHKCKCH